MYLGKIVQTYSEGAQMNVKVKVNQMHTQTNNSIHCFHLVIS